MREVLDELPPYIRLALSYAPASSREPTLALLQLDARLGEVVRSVREPILAQMRLAWWRDRLSEDPLNWPEGEPLLAHLRQWGDVAAKLIPLVDAWELLIGEDQLTPQQIDEFGFGRGAGWGALADHLELDSITAARAGAEFSLVDLACHLSSPEEQETVSKIIEGLALSPPDLPRALRPLAILHAISRRAVASGRGLMDGPGALAVAMRVGIFGR